MGHNDTHLSSNINDLEDKMTDDEFLNAIFQVAEELKRCNLTPTEKKHIIDVFNATSGDNYVRAREAIKQTVYKDIPERFSLKNSAGSVNHLMNKVALLKAAATEWKKK
jgi:hypothetical protein